MPYSKWSEVNDSIKGIEPRVSLAQANGIADCADSIEDVESPWAVCIATFRKGHRIEGGKWVKRKESEAEAQQYGELIPLAEFEEGEENNVISVQIMRPGKFTEMHGKEVELTAEVFADYISNFEADVAGQQLPIFVGHPDLSVRAKEPAAAWYKRLYTKVVDGVTTLWADIELSGMGQEVLEKKLYKYLSPTVDLINKVIRGGGFVNLPAIKGQPAMELGQFLQPVDLAEIIVPDGGGIVDRMAGAMKALKALADYLQPADYDEKSLMCRLIDTLQALGWLTEEMPPASELSESQEEPMNEQELAQLRETIRAEVEAELAEGQQERVELAESIRKEVRAELEAEFTERAKRQAELAEFVMELTSGEFALATPPNELTAVLAEFSEAQLEAIRPILKAKVADFSEHGHTSAGNGRLKSLDPEVEAALKAHLELCKDKGKGLALFIKANFEAEGLNPSEYDFSEFAPAD